MVKSPCFCLKLSLLYFCSWLTVCLVYNSKLIVTFLSNTEVFLNSILASVITMESLLSIVFPLFNLTFFLHLRIHVFHQFYKNSRPSSCSYSTLHHSFSSASWTSNRHILDLLILSFMSLNYVLLDLPQLHFISSDQSSIHIFVIGCFCFLHWQFLICAINYLFIA